PKLLDQLEYFEHFLHVLESKLDRDQRDQQQQDLHLDFKQQHDEHQHAAGFRQASGRSSGHHGWKHPCRIAQHRKRGDLLQ
ncbi:unnamed protein product, partial [Durusdinium trenchii]